MRLIPALSTTLPVRLMRVGLVVLFMVMAVAPASGAEAQENETPQLTVLSEALNVRSGPDVGYAIVAQLLQGDIAPVIGKHTPTGWWQVVLPDGQPGWVSGGDVFTSVSGDTGQVPEITGFEVPATAVAGNALSGASKIVLQPSSGDGIYVVNADGTDLRYLTTGIDPALSPDGTQVAFTRWDTQQNGALGSLWIINADGNNERIVRGEIGQPKSPTWSPDGKHIVVSMQEGGRLDLIHKCASFHHGSPPNPPPGAVNIRVNVGSDGDLQLCYDLPPNPQWGLRLINVDTGDFKDLARDAYSYSPSWDPSNDWRLVYRGDFGLVGMDVNRGTTWVITDDVNDHSPVFSPDGSKIAVSYMQHDHWEIHVVNSDGTGRVRLTETPLRVFAEQRVNGQEPRSWNNTAPAWSPDGSQIAFLTDRNGGWEIWIMNSDGSDQHPLMAEGVMGDIKLEYNGVDERILSWR